MKTLAIVHPSGLLGDELRDSLARRRELWREVRLLSGETEEIGTLTEVAGSAAMVQGIDERSFDGVDGVFFCGPAASNRPLLEALPGAAHAIVLSPDAEPDDGHPLVAAVNLETALAGETLLSPHPGVVLLAHLLHPLSGFHVQGAAATLLQPVSTVGREALDEVLDQTRRLLGFQGEIPTGSFPAQLAFNLLPTDAPIATLGSHLQTVLGQPLELSLQVLQAGVFHSYGAGLHVRLGHDPGLEEVRQALADHPANELVEEPEKLGPITAAARDSVLVGQVSPVPGQAGAYTVWAVMDNLTCGGALNALQIYEAVGVELTH